jgi:polyferredoxin
MFQLVLIGYVGLVNGQLLAQSIFGGWPAHGVPWQLAPGFLLLAAAALVVPWTSRRAIYCSQICPHGAAQELVGRITKRKWPLPRGVERGLRFLPLGLIAMTLVVTILNLPFDLAGIEPFDAYLIRAAGVATIVIAVVGLIAAVFVPMAYCKYGCPTGMVLSFVRSHGAADRFSRRDLAAAVLVVLALALYLRYDVLHQMVLHSRMW